MSPIDHLDLVVTSRERSLAFHRGLLEPLGHVRTSKIAAEVWRLAAGLERLEAGNRSAS